MPSSTKVTATPVVASSLTAESNVSSSESQFNVVAFETNIISWGVKKFNNGRLEEKEKILDLSDEDEEKEVGKDACHNKKGNSNKRACDHLQEEKLEIKMK